MSQLHVKLSGATIHEKVYLKETRDAMLPMYENITLASESNQLSRPRPRIKYNVRHITIAPVECQQAIWTAPVISVNLNEAMDWVVSRHVRLSLCSHS